MPLRRPISDEERPLNDDDDDDNSSSSSSSTTTTAAATILRPEEPSRPPSTEFDRLLGNTPCTSSTPTNLLSKASNLLLLAWSTTTTWIHGPQPPKIHTITPFFPSVQTIPLSLLAYHFPRRIQKIRLLFLLSAIYLITFSLLLRANSQISTIPGYGRPVPLGCGTRYWGEGPVCGVDGVNCRPFGNSTLAFRCPADCQKQITSSHHAVGDQDIRYAAILVGGPTDTTFITTNTTVAKTATSEEEEVHEDQGGDVIEAHAIYRSDSFICSAAIHSGYFSASTGGCGVLTLTGERDSFSASQRNGLTSLGFDSYFPHSFAFLSASRTECADLRWPGLFPTLIFTILISLFTSSPATFFWTIFPSLFFHVAFLSDPPPTRENTFPALFSLTLARFLPAAFCAWVVYRYVVLRTLTDLEAQFEKTFLWLGAAWIGALNNYTFDRIPIQRLTAHDLRAQPGAMPALMVIVGAIFIIALGQAAAFRVEGRMPRYLAIYAIFVASILVALMVPGLKLRIHHYVLALLLLPGTSFQNRQSLVYQGLLLGLFVNGVARWGFASVLETEGALLGGDHQGTLLPRVEVLGMGGVGNITFGLGKLPVWDQRKGVGYDGVSVLVNDVERWRGFEEGEDVQWTWEKHVMGGGGGGGFVTRRGGGGEEEEEQERKVLPEYFRFAYVTGNVVGDYTKAGKWTSTGDWVEMGEGASK